jgi:hypothetical protein
MYVLVGKKKRKKKRKKKEKKSGMWVVKRKRKRESIYNGNRRRWSRKIGKEGILGVVKKNEF